MELLAEHAILQLKRYAVSNPAAILKMQKINLGIFQFL